MRLAYVITMILGHFSAVGQLDSLGLGNDPALTTAEAHYFNDKFIKERGQFNFKNKRIVFITGIRGSNFMSKQDYFAYIKQWTENDSEVVSSLFILTKEEKEDSGYDAIITAWVKILTDQRRNKIVRQLKASR